ncbi:hypothetical protein QTO30_08520 [Yoonia sp. GPGPB17]|uniref:type II secretion system protein N n=1 Tax=Yoonia sp. GPGPB17 TaxID=3026147 RepID=UPI0030C0606B
MMSKSQDRILGLAVAAVFCALIIWIWLPQTPAATPAASSPARDVTARLAASQERLADLIAVTSERPLFDATRRPVAAPEVAAPVAAPEPVLTLVGILGIEDEKVALVRISTSAQLYQLNEGDTLGAWDVLDIAAYSITVRKDGDATQELFIDR